MQRRSVLCGTPISHVQVPELAQANEFQKKARKKQCILIMIFLLIIGAVVGGFVAA
jgi:predicted nucleic acid-binding Zn ribbon protein